MGWGLILDPVALRLGPIEIRWYGVLMAVALLVGLLLASREARRQGIDPDLILTLIIIGAPLGWLGARLYYVVFRWDYYSSHLAEIPRIWEGGLAIHGGLMMATLVGIVFARRYRLNFWSLADVVAPSFALGQAIGRWGNFFNQEAYGYPTSLPWAIFIDGAYRHPAFFYESLWDLGVFVLLLWWRRRSGTRQGEVFLVYLGAYSVGRFLVEGLRTDSLMIGQLRAAQVVSVLLVVVSLILIIYRRRTGVPGYNFRTGR